MPSIEEEQLVQEEELYRSEAQEAVVEDPGAIAREVHIWPWLCSQQLLLKMHPVLFPWTKSLELKLLLLLHLEAIVAPLPSWW